LSKKSEFVARVIGQVKLRWPYPGKPKKGLSLLEQGLVLVLMRFTNQTAAEAAVAALREAYKGDWNEVRVSQTQELAGHVRGQRTSGWREAAPMANAVRDYLQEVFQITHGLDLEFLREDAQAAGKWLQQVPYLSMTGAAYLLWVAQEGELPIDPALAKILDRLDLISRTNSLAKAKSQIEPLVPEGKTLEFTLAFHEIADRWGDPAQPIFEEFEVLREVTFGRKAFQERQTQLARAEAQRKRELARQQEQERKDRARREREEARERKRREAEEKKREQERKRKEAIEARKREQELKKQKRLEEQRKKKEEDARKKAAGKKKAAEDKQKAAARKRAAAAKQKAAKRPAARAGRRQTATRKKATTRGRATARTKAARKRR
jgi:hypothetical protein